MSEWAKLINSVVPKIAAIKAREMLRDLDVMAAILKIRTKRRKAKPKKTTTAPAPSRSKRER